MKEIGADLEMNEKIEEIEALEKKVKQRKPNKLVLAVKEWMESYGKLVGTILVAVVLVCVCASSFAIRLAEEKVGSGVMITLSDVAGTQEAFAGETFQVAGITYGDMATANYETDQLAQLERSEKQIDEILSAKRQDKKDQAALEALTAVHTVITDADVSDQVVVAAAPETQVPAETAQPASTTVMSVAADPNGNYQYLGEFLLTAYCPCPICCGKWSNMVNPVTASGNPAVAGWSIAADRKYPFGTKIMIDGHIYSVEDRGGAINGNHFDVYCNSHAEALAFNMRTTSAYLVVQ